MGKKLKIKDDDYFIEKWAYFVRDNSDKIWSKQQKILIDSQIKNAKKINLSKKQVDYINNNTL
ncbi:MAG: hypothetical protein QXM96_00965 [Candidatus Woesearchaeota archaeon]